MEWTITQAILIAGLGALLVSAGIEDARRREIANWKNAAIALAAPLWWWSLDLSIWPGMGLQLMLAIVIFSMFAMAFQFGWMGGGDVKLISALALWLPFGAFVTMLMVMSIVGGLVTIAMMIDRRLRRSESQVEIPYGVAIAIAALLAIREPLLNQFQ